jgi:hypothetical protein
MVKALLFVILKGASITPKFTALIIVSAKECRGAAKAYSLGFLTPGQVRPNNAP